MTSKKHDKLSEEERVKQDILAHRKFSLAEAIGRMGGDLLKGVSPVSGKQQAEFAIEHYLREHLRDAEGALQPVLHRYASQSDILLEGYERPYDALSRVIEHLLDSDERLRRFVGQVDTEWGRIYAERPRFEFEGRPPRSDDPYTIESVRGQLTELLASLNGVASG